MAEIFLHNNSPSVSNDRIGVTVPMQESGAMKSPWKTGIIVAFIVLLVGGSAVLWLAHKRKADERRVAEAANACRIRAEQGDPKAESELAYMYSHGLGVPQDYSEALRLRRKSADQGNASGEVGLAYMYLHGQGVPQDNSEALRWYRKAADSGDAYAENNLGLMYESGGLVPQDYAEALRWYRKAVDQNYRTAQYNLGNLYYYGHGVPRDVPGAYLLYHKAAAQGDEYAQQVLGLRGRGLSAKYMIPFSICGLGSILLLTGNFFSANNAGNGSRRSTTAAGLMGLCCAGLGIYAHSRFCVFPSELAVNGFTFARYLVTGAFVFLAACIVLSLKTPTRIKAFLGILGTLILVFNASAIAFKSAHPVAGSLPPAARVFFSTNGMLLGMVVSLVVLLLLNNANGTTSRNDESTGFEEANEGEERSI
jgi:hypothetical protein